MENILNIYNYWRSAMQNEYVLEEMYAYDDDPMERYDLEDENRKLWQKAHDEIAALLRESNYSVSMDTLRSQLDEDIMSWLFELDR